MAVFGVLAAVAAAVAPAAWSARLGRGKGGGWRILRWGWRAFLGYCVVLAAMRMLAAWPHARSAGDWVLYPAGMTEESAPAWKVRPPNPPMA